MEVGNSSSIEDAASDSMLIVDAYAAAGQVAGTGHVGPRWIPAEAVVLSGGLFGVMWIELGSFSVFRRLPVPLTQLPVGGCL